MPSAPFQEVKVRPGPGTSAKPPEEAAGRPPKPQLPVKRPGAEGVTPAYSTIIWAEQLATPAAPWNCPLPKPMLNRNVGILKRKVSRPTQPLVPQFNTGGDPCSEKTP